MIWCQIGGRQFNQELPCIYAADADIYDADIYVADADIYAADADVYAADADIFLYHRLSSVFLCIFPSLFVVFYFPN